MIVSRATARTFWGDDDPLGRTVRRVADGKDFTVVGIVGDVRSTTLNRESPALYYSSGARTWALMDIVVRTAGDPGPVLAAIRRTVHAIDPELPLSNVRPMTEWVTTSAAQPRLNATLLGVFACVALLVAAIGTYGVLAYSVSQRTKELGLRMALGADRTGVLRLIVREGMSVGLAGIAIGVAGAIAASRALSALVFGVSVRDPSTYAGVAAVLALSHARVLRHAGHPRLTRRSTRRCGWSDSAGRLTFTGGPVRSTNTAKSRRGPYGPFARQLHRTRAKVAYGPCDVGRATHTSGAGDRAVSDRSRGGREGARIPSAS
jgi:hypothetical protein